MQLARHLINQPLERHNLKKRFREITLHKINLFCFFLIVLPIDREIHNCNRLAALYQACVSHLSVFVQAWLIQS